MSAPLILGLDLTDTATLSSIISFITNPEAIAVNQNWAGHPGRLAASYVPSGWTHDHGALTAGHDRPGWPKNATLAAAEKACEGDSGCGGLTYHSSDPTPAGLVQIYLKDVGATPNADANWTHYSRADPVQVWVKPQPAKKLAVYVVNPAPSGKPASLTLDFATLGLTCHAASVRDLWARQEIGEVTATLKVTVQPLDSAFYLLTPA